MTGRQASLKSWQTSERRDNKTTPSHDLSQVQQKHTQHLL
jgi:hypothetical protein